MEKIKVVLLFNEDNERQRTVGRFLKTQQRCKTALITELVYDWLQKKECGQVNEQIQERFSERDILEKVKASILSDKAFVEKLSAVFEEKSNDYRNRTVADETDEGDEDREKQSFDMDEDMLLAGLSLFESQML